MAEVSAFDDDAMEEMIETQTKKQLELEQVPVIVRQMHYLQVDFRAVRQYFKQLKIALKNDAVVFKKAISEMTELILHEWKTTAGSSSPEMMLMCGRGLLMLLHIEELGEFDWF